MSSSRECRPILLVLVPLLLAACALLPGLSADRAGQVASFDGVKIRYETSGEGAPALVFVHGWACNRRHWRAQMEEFRGRHRVVAVDLGGHGESGKDRADWTLEGLSRDLSAVLDRLDLKDVILVGHSMGGPVSLMAAAQRPERVIGVIGADTLHDAEMKITLEMIQPVLDAMAADFAGACRDTVRSAFPPESGADPALIARIEADMRATGPAVAIGLMRAFVGLDVAKILKDCPVPVRSINAATPNETKVETNRKHARDFDVVLMKDVSHFLMLERPDEFNRLLQDLIAAWPD